MRRETTNKQVCKPVYDKLNRTQTQDHWRVTIHVLFSSDRLHSTTTWLSGVKIWKIYSSQWFERGLLCLSLQRNIVTCWVSGFPLWMGRGGVLPLMQVQNEQARWMFVFSLKAASPVHFDVTKLCNGNRNKRRRLSALVCKRHQSLDVPLKHSSIHVLDIQS